MAGSSTRFLRNPRALGAPEGPAPAREPLAFHRRLPGYAPTPLVDAPDLAAALGLGSVWVKDESSRLGLPSFKILGASWAIYRVLAERLDGRLRPWQTFEELVGLVAPLRPLTLTAATDGNHGRAVARIARLLGLDARIFVPAGMVPARIEAIESEGAQVTVVDGTYDDAVARSAEEARARCLVVSDTSWPGYTEVPQRVIEGYSTIHWEVDDQLAERGLPGPDLVVVQIGVGALAASVVRHYRRSGVEPRPTIFGVEPTRAACMLASMEAGRVVSISGPHDSIMSGLNCGAPSLIAWPVVSAGVDLFAAVEDERACEGMRLLADAGVVAGETGAAGLAGLIELLHGQRAEGLAAELGIGPSTRVLLYSTEGATDPDAYERIVGRPAGR